MSKILQLIPHKFIVPLCLLGGIFIGLAAYTAFQSNIFSYLSSDPSACVNCHVMAPYYATWSHSSHHIHTNCNDCHVPHPSILAKYYFKAKDGLYHAAIFTTGTEPQVLRPRTASATVIMNNCIRCHAQLNQEFVKTGMISYVDTLKGQGKVCWDCHNQVPHTKISNLASVPDAVVPYLGKQTSHVADWLTKRF